MNEAFRALTGGGVRFDRKRFASDVQAFEVSSFLHSGFVRIDQSSPRQPKTVPVASSSAALPSELDFFGTAKEDTPEVAELDERAEKKKNKKRKRAEEAAAAADAAGMDWAAFLRSHRIKYTGLDAPNPVTSIADLTTRGCPKILSENWKRMGLTLPTAVQMASWGVMLEKRDLLACAPTGSGKTLSFILPVLALNSPSTEKTKNPKPLAVILEPTRELAMQVFRETSRLAEGGGWVVKVLGDEQKSKKGKKKGKKGKGKGKEEKKAEVEEDEEAEEEKVAVEEEVEAEPELSTTDVLITTPLRLIYAIKAKTVDVSNVRHLILDEADKLFELNFVEQTDEIIAACTHPDLRKGMFSATMPSGVEELAKSVMSGGGIGHIRAIIGHKDSATETIQQSLQFVGTEDHKLLALRSIIRDGGFTPPVLIFVQSILRAKELSTELLLDGINADSIHAERTPEERDDVVRGFAEGKIWCLISTDVMGRGVDFKGVKLVINYDFPQSGGSYIHRIGRTGRAGKTGRAVTFFTKSDAPYLKSIVNVMRASGCAVPQFMLDLKNPTQDEKKKLRMKPIGRKDISKTSGAGGGNEADRKNLKGRRKRVMGGKMKQREEKGGKEEKKGGEEKAQKAKKAKKSKEVSMEE
ncbi:ATP-dependent rna helicase rok1 [Pseudohyphozyma bogoriensis]|nr:ATP-dependent rna helicase rok1 [Pseudohyphozyma bogoriensis]